MINKEVLPVREFKIDENGKEFGSLDAVSIVTDPAIELSFQLFNKSNINHFASAPVANEKMQITGPVMVPNKKMLREDPNTKEFFMAWFSEDTIAKCAANFLSGKKHTQANLEHSQEFSKDYKVIESWLVVDPENDKANALGFKDLVKGMWFITYQVKNRDTWNKIKDSNYRGFSVEVEAALFSTIKESAQEQEAKHINQIKEIVFSNKITDVEKEAILKDIIKNYER